MAKRNQSQTTTDQEPETAPETVEETTPETTPENVDPLEGLSEEGSQPFVDTLLTQAEKLEEEKQAIYEKISANRETLRTVAKTGLLSEKQAKAITLWYPVRQKKATETETAAA